MDVEGGKFSPGGLKHLYCQVIFFFFSVQPMLFLAALTVFQVGISSISEPSLQPLRAHKPILRST